MDDERDHPDERRLVDAVDDFFDGVFVPLEEWLPTLRAQLSERLAPGSITGAGLVALIEADAHRILEHTDRPLYGAGYCATAEMVSEGNPLAWWQGPDRSLLASSTFGPGQAAIDLQRLEWYRVPAETHERHIAGPFVDYLCSNEITLTSALPVMIDGEFAGVACADVLVASLEDLLLPEVSKLPGATLINANGRVIVSADPAFETGDRFPGASDPGANGLRETRSRSYPFALVVPQ
ncbi:MAG: hypothetical protein J0H64_04965 [Actinobacteria bacterium]|nr:hypothetical protein [Actinomycetota bacterium]